MPIIRFQCEDCNKKFDELVYSHNRDKVRCPQCEGQVKQIYEGKYNSLQSTSKDSGGPGSACHTCPMGCKH